MTLGDSRWYAVRTICQHKAPTSSPYQNTYEERVLLFLASGEDDAIAKSEAEAKSYDGECVGYHMVYELDDGPISSGHEVFSLMRDSDYSPGEYLDCFHATGTERARTTDVDGPS